MCLNRRWGTIDGHGWTHIETEAACNQLEYSTSGMVIPPVCFKRFIYYFSHAESTFTKVQRTQLSSQYLPVHMTLVSCYSSNISLINCSYHEFSNSTTTSMDIFISCGSQGDEKEVFLILCHLSLFIIHAVDIRDESSSFSC